MSKDGPIYKKYHVERTDGESGPNGKHRSCEYFVLDMSCDPYAVPALRAYADACQETHPTLAADIRSRLPEPGATEKVKWRDASALRDRIRQLEAERDTAWNDAIEAAAKAYAEHQCVQLERWEDVPTSLRHSIFRAILALRK